MFHKSLFYPFLFISLVLSSCEFQCSVGDSGTANDNKKYKAVEKDGMLLYNGIKITARGVSVDKAYLVSNDDAGQRIGEDNFVDFERGVKLIIMIEDGWKEVEGKMRIGASLKAVAENGEVIIDEQDMMNRYDEEGVSPVDSKILGLSVYNKNMELKQPISITVQFKVWDKQSDAFLEGDYTFHTK